MPPLTVAIPSPTLAAVAASNAGLEAFLDKTIDDICPDYGSVGDALNHCAHFVGHAISLRYPGAALCSNVAGSTTPYADRANGVCIRVNEIFNRQSNRRYWDASIATGRYLIYATIPGNLSDGPPITMGSMSRKHIGFFVDGQVYHYSNTQDKVIKQTTAQFSNHYGATTKLLLSDMPGGTA